MLRTNLSTRPFYNLRAVQVTLGALAVLLLVVTLVNVFELVRLTSDESTLGARAAAAEEEAAGLRAEALRIRQQIDPREMSEVAARAAEANGIIDLRTFSWTDLFARLETALPDSVRLTAFDPAFDRDGRFIISARVQARRVADLETFLDALEEGGAFRDVLAAEELTNPDGLIDAVVRAIYAPAAEEGPVAAATGAAPVGGNTGG